jgi:hypothetical protein
MLPAAHLNERLQDLNAFDQPLQLPIADLKDRQIAPLDIGPRQKLEARSGRLSAMPQSSSQPDSRPWGAECRCDVILD